VSSIGYETETAEIAKRVTVKLQRPLCIPSLKIPAGHGNLNEMMMEPLKIEPARESCLVVRFVCFLMDRLHVLRL
jgi:hypothetical protein